MKIKVNMIKQDFKKEDKGKYSFASDNRINTDPNGTWTGVSTENDKDMPIQDADDL